MLTMQFKNTMEKQSMDLVLVFHLLVNGRSVVDEVVVVVVIIATEVIVIVETMTHHDHAAAILHDGVMIDIVIDVIAMGDHVAQSNGTDVTIHHVQDHVHQNAVIELRREIDHLSNQLPWSADSTITRINP